MRYLTIEQRETLHRQLGDRAAALRKEIAAARLANHLEEIDDDAVADLESSIEIAEIERDVRELREVETGLKRLHEPEYGVCSDCGADIPYSRLSASPSTTRCVACQRRVEELGAEPARPSL